ncbi:uncharacterized protein KY384_002734 [Bacidia gigantensis]|uniref:uncharacterized protein n=1 Tax=Bacidia gigantensis TaxID=2732470 RepID=UPI001D03ED85|nr:uncharacterized protein KY384_002734 [Bacidia gigantensis]KAG8532856.1 hypothetical protein KY384_002734 [Bacidia gigantensis]
MVEEEESSSNEKTLKKKDVSELQEQVEAKLESKRQALEKNHFDVAGGFINWEYSQSDTEEMNNQPDAVGDYPDQNL